MAGETKEKVSGWTVDTLKVLHDQRFELSEKFQERFKAERDRRYHEVAVERDKALKIKEEADRNALVLAREIQTYKDEKANELREQINRERGLYATHDDLKNATEKMETLATPLVAYVAGQQGRGSGLNAGWAYLINFVTLLGVIIAIVVAFRH